MGGVGVQAGFGGGVLALPSSVDLAVQLPPFLSPAALGKGLPGGGGLPLRSWELLGAKPAWVCHPLAPCPGPPALRLRHCSGCSWFGGSGAEGRSLVCVV